MLPRSSFDPTISGLSDRSLRAVCLLIWLTYTLLLIGWSDVTFHSVDSVRDVALARAIADGSAFPVVSQPWATTYQTPPGYLYLLSIPFLLGGDERSAFIFVAILCLSSVFWVWRLTFTAWGAKPATLYVATALVFPTSIFFHSAGNPSFAFALSSLALGCVIRIAGGAKRYSVPLVFFVFMLPQLHLSSTPIALLVIAWLLIRPRERLNRFAIVLGGVLLMISLVWLWKYGLYAPEYVSTQGAFQGRSQLFERVLDPQQWFGIASVYVNYARHIADAPVWLVVFVAAIALYLLIGVLISIVTLFARDLRQGKRFVIVATVCSVGVGVAYLDAWGVWYFDSWLPWLSMAAAIGWSAALNRVAGARWLFPAFVLLIGTLNAVPQWWLHLRLASVGYLDISPSALFSSRSAGAPLPHIVAISSRHQLAYRDYLAANALCLDDVVGVSEWYLRDITRRDGYVECQRAGRAYRADARRLHLSLHGFDQRQVAPSLWTSGPLRISALPPQPRIRINDELRASKYGSTLERYGLYLPEESASAMRIAVELNRSQSNRVRVALRCIGIAPTITPTLTHGGALPNRATLVTERALLAVRYFEYEFEFSASESSTAEPMTFLELSRSHRCDVSAFVL
jgi:hypothetical protein